MKSDIVVSQATRARAQQVKKYIEKKYNLSKVKEEERALNWQAFEEKVRLLNVSIEEKQKAKKNILHQEGEQLRKKRQKISKRNFQPLTIIGRGAFGEVRLCRQKKTGRTVAIKCLKKTQMIKKNQQQHIKAERNMLACGGEWIVSLLYSFQDQSHLYLVMQYLAGGDLMNLLILRNVLEQKAAKFYAAQIVLAIESIHKKNYIHRDLKPDNVLIDAQGHIKLSDFGLCKQTQTEEDGFVNQVVYDYVPGKIANATLSSFKKYLQKYQSSRNRKLAFSAVGTPDYIAPEMLRRVGYTQLVDWWALGVIVYEMLVGYAPFSADSNDQIYYKIQHFDEYLYFPPQIQISFEVIDLISRLLADHTHRLGRNGPQQIRNHPWFSDINWQKIKQMEPPFLPKLTSEIDSQYFDKYEQIQPWLFEGEENKRKDFNFIGYTYKGQPEGNNNRNAMNEEIERLELLEKQQKEQQREIDKISMKKKNKIMVYGQAMHHDPSKNVFQKLQISQNPHRLQVMTQRTKFRKSKSPLQPKDTNRIKTKQSVSKSPLKLNNKQQRISGMTRKVTPLNLQGLTITTLAHSSGQLSKTLTSRKSARKVKQR